MIVHGYIPTVLLMSTIVSLFNSICKRFDDVLLYVCRPQQSTSDMQFRFKARHSTSLCTLIFKEAMNHYLSNRGNVYSCMLDASKAFDLVHYGKLFRIVMSKQMPTGVIRLILDSYTIQLNPVILTNKVK